jgi:hypothetical protein
MTALPIPASFEPATASLGGRGPDRIVGVLLWAAADIRRSRGSVLAVALLIAMAGVAGIDGARRAASSVDRFVEALRTE